MDYVTAFVLIIAINLTSGVSLRHGHSHSKLGVKRHMRRELEMGVRYPNQPFLSYETQNNSIIVTQVGGSALLRCYTENLGEELVTWLKRDDEQLLTAGPQVYSSENRYSVSHIKHQKLWELKIRDVQTSDAGSYECQLTTHPPISILMSLKVVEARAVISGRKELHVHEGSRLRLVCRVEEATEPPLFVFWFHNGSMVNYEANRPLSVTNEDFGSTLTISHVSRTDAGAYRCEPSNAKPDNITLHVVADENSAAMQRGVDKKARDQNSSTTTALATQSRGGILSQHVGLPCFVVFIIIHHLSSTYLSDATTFYNRSNSQENLVHLSLSGCLKNVLAWIYQYGLISWLSCFLFKAVSCFRKIVSISINYLLFTMANLINSLLRNTTRCRDQILVKISL